MGDQLKVQVADADQRRAAHANVHDVWGRGLPLEQHIERRLHSALHQRATWYVGTLDGKVVSGLGAHPVVVRLRGKEFASVAIASVHTLADYRGRGFAPQLIAEAERLERLRGARLALLFSDVDPAYYERMGYRRCPAHQGWSLRGTSLRNDGRQRFWKFDPNTAIAKLSQIFESSVARVPLAIARPEEYWRHLMARSASDEFHWLIVSDEICGYARTADEAQMLKLRDYGVLDDDDHLRGRLFCQLAGLAVERNLSGVRGWLPDDSIARQWFEIEPRAKEITMFKSLDPAISLDAEALLAADRFCEIDHV